MNVQSCRIDCLLWLNTKDFLISMVFVMPPVLLAVDMLMMRMMVVMVMMMMPFLILHRSVHVRDHELTAISLCRRLLHNVMSRRTSIANFSISSATSTSRLMKIFPCLTVIAIQTSSGFRTWGIKWCYRITVRGSSMAIVFGTTVSIERKNNNIA